MVNVILISNGENHKWYDWLSTQLVKRGHVVLQPPITTKNKTLKEGIEQLKDYRKYLDEESIMIGHGAGRAILIKILEEKLREIKGAFLVSGKPLNKEFKDFQLKELDINHVKDKAKNFFVYATENDDDETIKETEIISNILEEEFLLLDNTKHFNDDETFEDLLIDILSITH